jgi:glycosyltransferase involved in cell wall biosynthesis
MKFSIIIPTLNEEKFLPLLMESIKKQTFKDYEIIVADAKSKDKTRKIAKQYGAKVVDGGMPAVGRNKGAKASTGEIFLFLDADVILPKNFLARAHIEFNKRFLDLSTATVKPLSKLVIDQILHNITNIAIRINQYTNRPSAGGFCIFITRRLFNRIGGFNERLTLAEDHDLVKRASKFRQLRVLDSTYIYLSVRRLDKEGRIGLIKKYLTIEVFRLFKKEITKTIVEYEFGNYKKTDVQKLNSLNNLLSRINKELSHQSKKGINTAENAWKSIENKFKKVTLKVEELIK